MSDTAADRLVEPLIDWGVDTIFGLPGDGINGIMEALRRRRQQVGGVRLSLHVWRDGGDETPFSARDRRGGALHVAGEDAWQGRA